jgi:CRISPR system Cascade subunit CasD
MMSTLMIRLAAPLQSWGVDSKFNRRGTERIPTKSGVIGLLAAALGRRRNEDMADLYSLNFGVRTDREGKLIRDFHMVKSAKSAYVTYRYYLADAVFLAGVEGENVLLTEIDQALRNPAFPLFLGRRSCPPEGKVSLGIRKEKSLLEALKIEPVLIRTGVRMRNESEISLSIVTDAGASEKNIHFQRDIPLSFDQAYRKFGFRRVSEDSLSVVTNSDSVTAIEVQTQHDPMIELED